MFRFRFTNCVSRSIVIGAQFAELENIKFTEILLDTKQLRFKTLFILQSCYILQLTLLHYFVNYTQKYPLY